MKPLGAGLILICLVATVWFAFGLPGSRTSAMPSERPLAGLRAQAAMPPLDGAVTWLNSKPLTAAELRGKVVLVQFWTFSCINWLRTLPHVRAWADKYRDHGLVVIGVHTPEFGFEKEVATVAKATADLGVMHAVAVDSRQAIWRAFENRHWPAQYFVDARGAIRHRHFGEGDYLRSEEVIQMLLIEAGATGFDLSPVQVEGRGSQAEADWQNLRSPESYVGYARASGFASPGGLAADRQRQYMAPQRLRLNTWALEGEWTARSEATTSQRAGARVRYRFHARDLHLVMGPASGASAVPFRVLIDGRPPGSAHGADLDAEGRGMLVEHKLYQLLRQPLPIQERDFEIEFEVPGAELFAFTFG